PPPASPPSAALPPSPLAPPRPALPPAPLPAPPSTGKPRAVLLVEHATAENRSIVRQRARTLRRYYRSFARFSSTLMKRFAAAAERNKEPTLAVLREVLPASGTVLEIASGTGQHAAYFADALRPLIWLPTDRDPDAVASIAAYRAEVALDNLAEPLLLDAESDPWPIKSADAVVCINMIHIAPWSACLGLL